jgi:hypothetical protein
MVYAVVAVTAVQFAFGSHNSSAARTPGAAPVTSCLVPPIPRVPMDLAVKRRVGVVFAQIAD